LIGEELLLTPVPVITLR